jgi:hypothetical protein
VQIIHEQDTYELSRPMELYMIYLER